MSLAGELTYSELKDKLALNLKENSIGGKLKSQLRYFLIQRLQSKTPITNTKGLLLKAVDSLIIDYLRNYEHDFTLSVFLPESGLDHFSNVSIQPLQLFGIAIETDEKVMEEGDILGTMHLNSQSLPNTLYSFIIDGHANGRLSF